MLCCKEAGLRIPVLPITQATETDEVPPTHTASIGSFVSPCSSFVLEGTKSNRQSACPSEEQRGQPLSCYPFDLK